MNILLLGAMPPPVHGLSVANAKFAELAARRHGLRVVDATGARQDARAVGRFSCSKVAGFVGAYAGLRHLPWCDALYMTPGQTFLGLAKMAPFILMARSLGKPVVLHLHGGALGQVHADLKGVRKALFAHLVRSCSAAIVLSDHLRGNFDGLLPADRIHVVQNFADRRCFGLAPAFPERFDADHPLRVLYLSNLIPSKGAPELVAAIERLMERGLPVSLDLAGHAEPGIEAKVRESCARHPAIRYHGVATGSSKYDLLERSHVLALPTTYPMEGQPICILEAMAAGLGVLTTRHAGIPDIFPDSTAWFVERAEDSIASALEHLLGAPHEVREAGARHRALAGVRHSEEAFANGILSVLESLCPNPAKVAG